MVVGRLAIGASIACAFVALLLVFAAEKMPSDWTVLRSIWFGKIKGDTHSERLESFYAPQASSYDNYRKRLLWAKDPLLKQLSKEFGDRRNLVWVDLGGGTGSNVEMMETYLPLDHFAAIYVVDLCHSLCEEAKRRVAKKGWTNVHVVEGDACEFVLPVESSPAHLVTFSYALSMIPNFFAAVDRALALLSDAGYLGVCDFYVSAKYDDSCRPMSWSRRFFWQMIFDLDGVSLGPERRLYLRHRLRTVWEELGDGPVPYTLFLRAPWYAWIGRKQSIDL